MLIRADGDGVIGAGHVMRCLALAQAWHGRTGGAVTFLTHGAEAGLVLRIEEAGMTVVTLSARHPDPADLEQTLLAMARLSAEWLVLDGLHFDPEYQRRIKEAAQGLLVIDDLGNLDHYWGDVVLNQNAYAPELSYPTQPGTRLLLGCAYTMLRPEFARWIRHDRRLIPDVARRVIVTFGGGDLHDQTTKVIRALQALDVRGLEAVAVVGSGNTRRDALLRAAEAARPRVSIRLVTDAPDMAELMAWADVAVAGSGSTAWELAFMGLPVLLLIQAENQSGIAAGLESRGAAINLGWYDQVSEERIAGVLGALILDPERRRTMRDSGRRLVDGHGCERVLSALGYPVGAPPLVAG